MQKNFTYQTINSLFLLIYIDKMSTVKGIGSFGSTALLVSSMTVSCLYVHATII